LNDRRLRLFNKKWHLDPESGCHVWAAARDADSYGLFWDGTKTRLAHIVAWEHQYGPVPPDKEIDHKCRVRSCTNVEHLELVTHAENVERGLNARTLAAYSAAYKFLGSEQKQGPKFQAPEIFEKILAGEIEN
jgi:hypothetical protein